MALMSPWYMAIATIAATVRFSNLPSKDFLISHLGIGAENVSLSMDFPSSSTFRTAGYAPITTNDTYSGGLVRQHGGLSFSRVYQAGHGAAAYQPETFYRIFQRSLFGQDIATGEIELASQTSYATEGPASVLNITNEVPASIKNVCVVFDVSATCTPEQTEALADGTAVVENFIVVKPRGRSGSGCHGSGRQG